jgi:hypothetical protein
MRPICPTMDQLRYISQGVKQQGDKLSPLLSGLVFNALLLALKETGGGHRAISGFGTGSLMIWLLLPNQRQAGSDFFLWLPTSAPGLG